jgi:hypothetical protein
VQLEQRLVRLPYNYFAFGGDAGALEVFLRDL